MSNKILCSDNFPELFKSVDYNEIVHHQQCIQENTLFKQDDIGEFSLLKITLPGICILFADTYTYDHVILKNSTQNDQININFQLQGDLYSQFDYLPHDMNMVAYSHNLLFAPESGSVHYIKKQERMKNFHISIDKSYFTNLLADDCFTNRWLNNVEQAQPFTATVTPQPINIYIKKCIEDIKGCNWKGVMRKLYVEAKVMEILAIQIGQFKSEVTAGTSSETIDKIEHLKTLLDEHFLNDYTLYDLVKVTSMNEFKLKTEFKKRFGISVFGYLKQLRMNYAKTLLMEKQISVTQVSEILGYTHAHHFTHAFKKFHGFTPSKAIDLS